SSLKQLLIGQDGNGGIASLFSHQIKIGPVGGRPLGFIADALKATATAIDHALATLVLATEKSMIVLLHGMTKQAHWLGQVLGDLAETVEGKFRWWMALFPPAAAVWAAVKAYQGIVATVHALTAGAKHTVRVVQTRVQVLDKQARGELGALEGE